MPRIRGLLANLTALFWTAVSCCQEGPAGTGAVVGTGGSASQSLARWTLKHSKAYLIGRVDSPLLVQVDQQSELKKPRLLVSLSATRPDILRRLYGKGKYGKPRRLRERRAFDQISESVIVIFQRRAMRHCAGRIRT